jgi:Fuc2NAc and GlcNAc transferase
MVISFFLLVLIITSLFCTFCLRRYALAKSIIDVPNARSSHTTPTPRGGGVAIVICFLLSTLALYGFNLVSTHLMLALLGAGSGIALLGFLDDHGHIAARWRLLGHFFSALWVLFFLGGLPEIIFFGVSINFLWFGYIIAALYLVWMLNLYNFMDGIDGIASIQAITVCLAGAFFYFLIDKVDLIILPLALAACALGFLFWNFPPAKIFMGDAGSGFLGLVLGILSLQAAWISPHLFWCWIIMLGVFIVDATTTLLVRLSRREKVYEAHRSHAYQYAARHYGAHKPVSIAVALINCLWLFPWACAVVMLKIDGFLATLIAFIPLIVVAIKFNAGTREKIL